MTEATRERIVSNLCNADMMEIARRHLMDTTDILRSFTIADIDLEPTEANQ